MQSNGFQFTSACDEWSTGHTRDGGVEEGERMCGFRSVAQAVLFMLVRGRDGSPVFPQTS